MKEILILGSSGLLGATLAEVLVRRSLPVVCHSRRQAAPVNADLLDDRQVCFMLDTVRPSVIINLAALASVDECERNPQQAYLSNVHIVETLVAWMEASGGDCHLLQISTDQVYDGPGPHKETPVALNNIYSFSKYAGELAALRVSCTVLRTNFFGPSLAPQRTSLSDWLVKSLKAGEAITVFEDVQFSPLSMETLATVIGRVVVQQQRGIFNLGSRDGMSKADFAFALADALDLPTQSMRRGSITALKAVAYRPKDMRMECSRFESIFGIRLPSLRDEIVSMRNAYGSR